MIQALKVGPFRAFLLAFIRIAVARKEVCAQATDVEEYGRRAGVRVCGDPDARGRQPKPLAVGVQRAAPAHALPSSSVTSPVICGGCAKVKWSIRSERR